MVVLPAPSRPKIKIRTSFSPQSLLKRLLKSAPKYTCKYFFTLVIHLVVFFFYPLYNNYETKKEKENGKKLGNLLNKKCEACT